MTSSNHLLKPVASTKLLPEGEPATRKLIVKLLIVLAFLGFLDATYLTTNHYIGGEVPCSIGSCETVLTSEYATTVYNLPVAIFGAIYYMAVFLLLFSQTPVTAQRLGKVVLLTGAGLLASLYFIYLQIFVIKAICLYCMGSATITTLLFITTLIYWRKVRGV